MAYEPLTPARFKELKPQFVDVDDSVVQAYIDMASVFVDDSWPENVYEMVWAAMTCHLMTLDGLGSDAESKSFRSGRSAYQSIKSGNLTLTRFREESSSGDYSKWINSTKCGQYYATLLRMFKGGPRVIRGGVCPSPSGYAKDWSGPAYGWPGVFY